MVNKVTIDETVCKGCGLCKKSCPVSAISGEKSKTHAIDKKTCVSCGSCRSACPFGAIDTKGRAS